MSALSRVLITPEVPLLPCPFCGGPARMSLHTWRSEGVRYAAGCGTDACRVDAETVYAETQALAAHYWNDRKQEAPWRAETTTDLVLPPAAAPGGSA